MVKVGQKTKVTDIKVREGILGNRVLVEKREDERG